VEGPATVVHKAIKPLAGHRIAGYHPLSEFAANPRHLGGPRKAVAGVARTPRPVRPVRPTARQRAEAAAFARARQTGRPVVVASETTPTVEVQARPDGLLEMKSNVLPVRAKVHGVWRAINPVLRRTAAGTWAPTVASVPVRFSPGGTGPLVTVANSAGRTVSLYWPAALPRPLISGSVALYRHVLPGVDLRMEATGTGYQEALVVRSAAAAANPRLRSLNYLVKAGSGLVLRKGPGYSLGVIDARTRKLTFVVGRPLMWDSSHTQHFDIPATADAAGSGRTTQVPVSYRLAGSATATIVMAPPASALTGPRVRYPVYIDPEIVPGTAYYVQVMVVNANRYTQVWNSTTGTTSQSGGRTEIGFCGYSNCYWDTPGGVKVGYVDRDYFQFNTPALLQRNGQAATVYYGSFDIEQTANSDACVNQPTQLNEAGAINSSTTWGGPMGPGIGLENSNRGGGSSCPAGNVEFDSDDSSDSSMLGYLQADANDNWGSITFDLRAQVESNDLQYKLFMDNPTLSLYYNFAPLTPTGLSVQNQVTCSSTTYTSLTQPNLYATGTDNNPSPLQISLNYALQTSAGAAAGGTLGSPQGASGSQQSTTPSTALTPGAYQFQVSATNHPTDGIAAAQTGPTSAWYPFTVETGPTASQTPTITSFDYPHGQWGQPAGAPGVFTVGPGAASNIVGFAYSFDGGTTSEPVPNTATCSYLNDGGLGTSVDSNGDGGGSTSGELAISPDGTAQIQIPNNITPGRHTLWVRSFDGAHNASGEMTYTFYVAPNYQPTQPVTYINGSSLVAGATGANASLAAVQGNCCGLSWRGGSELEFNATAVNQTFTVTINVPSAGWWQIGAGMTKSYDFGQARVDLDQATSDINLGGTAGVPYDGYDGTVSLHYLDLGTQDLTAGSHTLTFTMIGKNASSGGYKTGINYITLSPTNRYEGESLPHSTPTAGTLGLHVLAGSPWSDSGDLKLDNSTLGAQFSVTFNAPVESDYALGVNLGTNNDYGSVRLDLDPASADINLGNTAASPLDEYTATASAAYVFLGGVHLTAGPHVLQVTVVGTDGSSVGNRYNTAIDFLEVAPVTGATAASFTSAMNNLGITADGATSFAGEFDMLGPEGGNLSLNSFHDAGITPGTATAAGSTFTLNGATFTMPQLNTNSSGTVIGDNVIPDGQTIPLPVAEQIPVTDVALLVATTCGVPAESPAMNATLGYNNGSSSQPQIPSIPDWTVSGSAQLVLDHRDLGTAVEANPHPPHLYEVLLPANPLADVKTITLPVMPVNFLNNTFSCATSANLLHILAIGIRPVSAGKGPTQSRWTGTYAGPMDTTIAPSGGSLNDTTIREVITTTSLGSGGSLRIQLSNAGSMVPVAFDDVTAGAQSNGAGTVGTPVPVTFGGATSVTIAAGGDVTSDPIAAPSGWAGQLVVSLHVPSTSAESAAPVHQNPNASTFYASGDQTGNSASTPFTSSTSGLLYVSRIDVNDITATDGTVAVLGDQTAAQAPAGTFGNWAADLPAALGSAGVTLPGSVVCVASTVNGTVTTASALSWLRNYVSAEPNLRDVIVSVGAGDVLAGDSLATIKANIGALVSAIQAYFVDNDPSTPAVQIVLTTIPPLGLPSADVREGVRVQVNSWITGSNTTAQVTSDIASAVDDPANINNVNPALMSGGAPTAQYYTDIANQIATDILNAIPASINGL
jgi:hypothetical protein